MNSLYNKKAIISLLGIIIGITYTIIFLLTKNTSSYNLGDVKILGSFAFIQFLYTILSWYNIKKNWIDPNIVFSLVMYAFMLSQPILEALDCSVPYRRLWGDFGISNETYYYATYYSMICVLFYHLGAISICKNQTKTKYVRFLSVRPMRIASIIVAVVAFPFYLSILIKQFIIVQTIGYAGLYNWEEYTSRWMQIIADAFVPSMLILFCISMRSRQNIKLISLIFIIFVFLPPFFLGGRSNAMISLAVFGIVYASVNVIKRKHLVIALASGILMLVAMNIVGKLRTSTERSLEALELASKSDEDNAALKTLEEMGWSMYPTAASIDAIPEKYDYSYGESYFWAGVSVIPNLGFWDGVHPGKLNDPGYKLNEHVNLGYGIGYSIVAGTYNEFGFLGFFIMFIYGIIFSKIFSYITPQTLAANAVKYIIAILILWFSIKFVRNSFDSFVRNIVFYVLPFYLMSKLGQKQNKYGTKLSRA